MDVVLFAHRLQALRRRIGTLFQSARLLPAPPDLLMDAFEELQFAMEQLQQAQDTIEDNQRRLGELQAAYDQERQRSHDALNMVPLVYFITGPDGTIKRLNHYAATFLNRTEKFLVGKSLAFFIPEGERRAFRSKLLRLADVEGAEECALRIQPYNAKPLSIELMVSPARDRSGRVQALHWLVRRTPHFIHTERDSAMYENASSVGLS